MQFLLQLERLSGNGLLPAHYLSELSSAIFKILGKVEPVYRHFLFVEGCRFENKQIKPFTFSSLNFDRYVHLSELDLLQHSGTQATLDIRFAVDRVSEELFSGLFLKQRIELGNDFYQVDYQITGIEEVPSVCFQDEMHFRSLSPIFVCTVRLDGETEYLSPYDERFAGVFKTNLLRKFLSLNPEIAGLEELEKYCPEIRFELTSLPKKKAVLLNGHSGNPIKANGYQFDFKLKASPILQELGYYGGFGSNKPLGFGCVGVVGD